MATLYVYIPGSGIVSREIPQKDALSIGQAPDNGLPIPSQSVSARHAEILPASAGGCQLRDLGSANKCWVNGVAVTEHLLKDGDAVRFGKIEGLFLETAPGDGKEVEPAPRGRLTLEIPEEGRAIFNFEAPATTVGWKSDNDVCIRDASISGHHAQFLIGEGKCKLRDLGSTNKTFLNQVPIVEAEVHDGDEIQFGAVRGAFNLQFGLRRVAAPAADPALTAQLETLKSQAENFRKEREGLDFHNKQLSEEIQELAAQLEKLKNESATRAKNLANGEKEAQEALAAAKTRATTLEGEAAAARQRAEKAERELHETKAQLDVLSGDQTGQQQKIASLMQARDALRGEKEQLAEQLAAAQTRVETEAKAAAEAVQKQKETSGRLLEQENALGELHAEIATLKDKLSAALEKRDETLLKIEGIGREHENDLAHATSEVAAAEARAAKAESELRETRQARELAERKVQDANALIQTLSGGQTGDRQQIATLTQARDALQQEKDRLSKQLSEAKSAAETVLKECGNLKNAATEARARAEALATDRDSLKAFEKTLEERIEDLTKERDRAKAAGTDLQTQIDMVLKDCDEAQATVTELRGKIETLTKESNDLKAAEVKLQGQIERLTEERDDAKTFSGKLQAQLDLLTKECDQARASGSELQTKLEAANRAAQASSGDLEARLGTLTRELKQAKEAGTELQGRYDALAKERDQARVAEAGLEAELETVSREHQSSRDFATQLQSQLDALTRELETFKAAEAELRGQLELLIKERQASQGSLTELQTVLSAVTRERDSLRAATTLQPSIPNTPVPTVAPMAVPQSPVQPLAPAPVPRVQPAAAPAETPAIPMPTVKMPGFPSAPARPPQPQAPAPTPVPSLGKLSLAKEEPVPPTADPRHSLIEITPPAHDPGMVSTRPMPLFGGGAPDLKKIIETAPEALNSMRRSLHAFIKNQMETSLLDEFQAGLRCMAEETRVAKITPVATLSGALEMLVDDLKKIPGQINPSSLRTVSQAIDFLVTLINEKNLALTKDPAQAHIIAVDDDPDACKTILAALGTINLQVASAPDAKTTLDALSKERFDLVLIDVGLPDINGFELCTRLRKLPDYKKVPVVFITGAVTVQNRVQSSLSGGNDFIAKPFNLLELGVKTLIWIFKGQIGLV